MVRAVRWTIAGGATIVTFGVCVAVVRALTWSWLPTEDGARLDTALAFAAIAATAVLAGLSWWATREQQAPTLTPPPRTRTLVQTATAAGSSTVKQTGGGAAQVEQHAEASDEARVFQSGGRGLRGLRTGPERIEQRAEASGYSRIEQSGCERTAEGA
ncbi:hypothetical protein A3Q37_01388 [Streptomyces sp. PTY087I2]|nr:hypothetical protein A3Q37_01388 [Streptomyces sp. PTY087I2]